MNDRIRVRRVRSDAEEVLLERVRQHLASRPDVVERRMMGVTCFMVGGTMCCGVSGTSLTVRVGRDAYERMLAEPHVRPMEVGGRRPTGFVRVDAEGVAADAALSTWIGRGLDTVARLQDQPPRAKRRRR